MATNADTLPGEIWKPVPSVASFEASNFGRIRGDVRPGGGQVIVNRILTGELLSSGYRTIAFWREGRRNRIFVHRLVCEAFHGDPFPSATVDHLDGDKQNNTPGNLEWVSRSENSRRQNADGRGAPKGEKHPIAKLTAFQAKSIFRLRQEGWGVAEIARLFCVSISLVYKILCGDRRPYDQPADSVES